MTDTEADGCNDLVTQFKRGKKMIQEAVESMIKSKLIGTNVLEQSMCF